MCSCECPQPECEEEQAREFKRGVEFAVELITSVLMKHADTPLLALQKAREVLLKK